MTPTDNQKTVRSNGNFIPGSVHYERRAYDNRFEVVGRLYDSARDALEVNIGGEVVLDVAPNRQSALEVVRFFRGQSNGVAQ